MIAVLCANVSGGQALRAMIGDREGDRSVERCLTRIRLASESYGGSVIGQGSDQLRLVFPRCSDAFLASGVIQLRVADLPAILGIKLAAHIGIGCGELLDEPEASQSRLEPVAAELADRALAAQTLFCLAEGKQEGLNWSPDCSVRPLAGAPLRMGERSFGVCEFLWQESRGLTPRRLAERVLVLQKRLRVCHLSREFTLDDDFPALTVGRHQDCDVILSSRRVSRQHARIERRGNQLVVIDQSANGTYIYQEGSGEIRLHQAERVLKGRGELHFGAAAAASDADKLIFEA